MKTIKLTGQVDEHHTLRAQLPADIPSGTIEFVMIVPETDGVDDEFSEDWMLGIGREWAAELSDPREDIYTLDDGVPVDGSR